MDTLTKRERSERMGLVRSKNSRSTEWRFRSALIRHGIAGWRMHDASLPGCPDFVFPQRRLAVFIDGCFWHACPICNRPLPRTNSEYWSKKIEGNVLRAKEIRRRLHRRNFDVMRVWEHDLRSTTSIDALLAKLFSP
jgi:DNA mismatch endonuclease (patch repair protein)